MTFLPIVERELRVAARRQLTFWLRVIAALTAFVIASGLLAVFMNIPGGVGAQPGGPLFAVLTWMSLVVALAAGLFFTSDALSEEKREGTLGFLFLTDLRGYDVVLGKLLATSCRCVYALLAIFPILACTQLFGGVEGGQFWRTILALLHTLFFSLTVGIFVSAISRHPQKALAGTLALLLLLVAGGAALDALFAYVNDKSFRPVLSLASPITAFINADGNFRSFWRALLVSQILAWVMLTAACLLIPRTWQERAARVEAAQSPWRSWWRFGSEWRRTHLRCVVLDQNPLSWLAGRERWQSLVLWAVAFVVLGWFGAVSLIEGVFLEWLGWGMASFLATLFLYLWTASQASQFFAETRRGGLLELLLATPLNFRSVAPGAWRGLLRLFGLPIGIVLLVQFVAAVSGVKGAGRMLYFGSDGPLPEWVLVWGAAGFSLVVSVANFVALAWFGLWMGLVSRNGLMATLKTIVFVQIIPWMVIAFASWMVFPLLTVFSAGWGQGASQGWIEWYPIISTVLATVLTLLKDYVFWMWARRKLVENFRAVAIQAIVPAGRGRPLAPPAPPLPPPLPPIIPSRPTV